MMMPDINGEKLSSEILHIRPGFPIIMYSGFSDSVDKEMLEKIGIKKWLRKPITIYALSVAIRQVLEAQE